MLNGDPNCSECASLNLTWMISTGVVDQARASTVEEKVVVLLRDELRVRGEPVPALQGLSAVKSNPLPSQGKLEKPENVARMACRV